MVIRMLLLKFCIMLYPFLLYSLIDVIRVFQHVEFVNMGMLQAHINGLTISLGFHKLLIHTIAKGHTHIILL